MLLPNADAGLKRSECLRERNDHTTTLSLYCGSRWSHRRCPDGLPNVRRSAEKAFWNWACGTWHIDGWSWWTRPQMAANLMTVTVERASEFAFLDPGKEGSYAGAEP
jgi:hypothetical protein